MAGDRATGIPGQRPRGEATARPPALGRAVTRRRSAAAVIRSSPNNTFKAVYSEPDGIAGYDLLSPADRVLVFDYNGDRRDDLFLYRPGAGAVTVARSNGNGTFDGVYTVPDNGPADPNGITGCNLLSPADRVLRFHHRR
jgi:1-phosphatidylinositol phosphodiesterase